MSKKILVVANKSDIQAKELVTRWGHQACLLTPENLSVKGWRYNTEDIDNSILVANGLPVVSHEVLGVFTRLHGVLEADLPHIVPADRAYVAAEMSAFLLAWLFALKCPVLNRPTPTSLSGPYWRQEKWISTAARLGIPVATSRRRAVFQAGQIADQNDGIEVTIIGCRHFGNIDPVLVRHARALAGAAGVDLLSVRFSGNGPGPVLTGAGFNTDLRSEDTADAILDYFREKSKGRPEMEN